jgi:MoaA/NifB/PqqE/SkfB family radical SAM enzyme
MQEKYQNSGGRIKIVDWLVTSKCMLDCPFCFRPSMIEKEIDPEEDKIVMEQIKESSVESVNLTGGEPLIRENIGNIARELYEAGKGLVLFTNTLLWRERIGDIQPYLSYIRIPLDGSTPEITHNLRGSSEQHKKIMDFLEYSSDGFEPTVYVGTVLTKSNKDDIINIGHIIERYPQIKKWSISQLTPRGRRLDSCYELVVNDLEFQDITSKVIETFPYLEIVPVDGGKRDRAYVLILPGLQVVTPCGNGYEPIGHLKENRLTDILKSPVLDLQKSNSRESCYVDHKEKV